MKKMFAVAFVSLALLVIPSAGEQPAYAGDVCTNRCLMAFTACRIACDVRRDNCKEECANLDDVDDQRRCRKRCDAAVPNCNGLCRWVFDRCMNLCE